MKQFSRYSWSTARRRAASAGAISTIFVALAWPVDSFAASSATGKPAAKQIDRGRYLVKTAGCNDCHTPGYLESAGRIEESKWLTGSALGWQGPWGTTYPSNLRLFVQGLTAEQWLAVARRETRPPMPWFALRDMTDEDLLAIYHFTRSLGPAGKAAPAFLPRGKLAQTPTVKIPG